MNTRLLFRIASFSVACTTTLAILIGVNTLATVEPAPVSMARAASAPSV